MMVYANNMCIWYIAETYHSTHSQYNTNKQHISIVQHTNIAERVQKLNVQTYITHTITQL